CLGVRDRSRVHKDLEQGARGSAEGCCGWSAVCDERSGCVAVICRACSAKEPRTLRRPAGQARRSNHVPGALRTAQRASIRWLAARRSEQVPAHVSETAQGSLRRACPARAVGSRSRIQEGGNPNFARRILEKSGLPEKLLSPFTKGNGGGGLCWNALPLLALRLHCCRVPLISPPIFPARRSGIPGTSGTSQERINRPILSCSDG